MTRPEKKTTALSGSNPLYLEVTLAIILFAIAALPYYRQIPNDLIGYPDEYKHLLIARSLAATGGLDQQHLIGIQYPPGWGTVIYILSTLFNNHLTAAHLLNTVLAWLTGPLVYLYLRKQTNPLLALAIGGYTSLHVLTISLGDSLLSEPIFVVVWFVCLIWLHRSMKSGWPGWILAGALIALSMSLRTVGLALWSGAVFYLGINSRNKLRTKILYIVCLSIIPIIYLALLNSYHPTGGIRADSGYGRDFLKFDMTESNEFLSGLVKRTVSNAVQHTRDLTKSLLPFKDFNGSGFTRLIWYAAAIGLVISAFIGWLRKIWRAATPMEYVFACYAGIVFLWPFTGALRLFWPVVPLVVYYAITNIIELKFWKPKSAFYLTMGAAALILMVSFIALAKNISVTANSRANFIENQIALNGAVAEARRLSADPVIAAVAYPQMAYWFPETRTCRLSQTTLAQHHRSRIDQCGANFLLLRTRFHREYVFKPLLTDGNSDFKLVFQNASVYLWQIRN